MFKLTEEQINYIIEYYGSSQLVIRDIERRLNLLGVIENEEDYYEIVVTVASQKQTINEQSRCATTREDAMRVWVSTDRLIEHALKDKYLDFSRLNPRAQEKMKSFR